MLPIRSISARHARAASMGTADIQKVPVMKKEDAVFLCSSVP
jgi:hypothetical protein